MSDDIVEVLAKELNKKCLEVEQLKKQLIETIEDKQRIEEEVRKLDNYKPEIDSVAMVPKEITLGDRKAFVRVTMIYYKPLEIQNSKVAQAFLEKYPDIPYRGPKPFITNRK